MVLLLYAVTAGALLWLGHRRLVSLSRPAALILFLLPFVFTGFALVTGRVYAPVDHPWEFVPLNWMKAEFGVGTAHNGYLSDVALQMIPWRAAVRDAWMHGQWPLWNPYLLGGDILAAAAQPAPFNPFTLLACLLPPALSMTFTAAITHFLAAFGAFLLARALGCREAAALVAAPGFTYATSVAFFILYPLGFAWAIAPFVLFAVHRASLPLLTMGFALLLLSGHPETALHVVTLAGVWAIVFVAPRLWPRLILAGILALLLGAIQIVPLLEAVPQTIESKRRNTPVASHDALHRAAIDVFPELQGRDRNLPPDAATAGSIVLALAAYAAVRVRTRASWTLAAIAVFGLLAHTQWRPVAWLFDRLPLFDRTLNERFSFGAALALSMLAALGVEELFRRERDRAALLTLAIALIVIVIGNALILRRALPPAAWGTHKAAAEVLGLAAALALLLLRRPQFVVAAILVQRFVTDGDIYHSFEQRVAYPPIPILAPLAHVREPFRITGHGLAFLPGASTLYGLEDVRGYQALRFRRTHETYPLWCVDQPVWFNRVDDLTRPFLSFLNVRYAITWDREPPPAGWREVARQRGSMLIENTRALDRAFVPARVRIGHDALREMATATDFRDIAWIEADLPPQERANGPGLVTMHGDDTFDVTMQNDGWVVVSTPAWKGWRAYVDGKRIATQFANHAFLAIHVPRGRHTVKLVFLPRSFVIGRAVSFATLALCAIAWTLAAFRTRRSA